jgi:hypothetical protein
VIQPKDPEEAEEAGRQARLGGLVREPPYRARALNRRWIAGYDEVQARIEAQAQWCREHAATVDEWGFI